MCVNEDKAYPLKRGKLSRLFLSVGNKLVEMIFDRPIAILGVIRSKNHPTPI